MRTHQGSWLKHLDFIVLDAVIIEISYFVALLWRYAVFNTLNETQRIYRSTAFIVLLFAVVLDIMFPFLHNVLKRGLGRELRMCVEYVAIILGLLIFYQYMQQIGWLFSRGIFLVFGATSVVLLTIGHSIYKKLIVRIVGNQKFLPKMILVSDADTAEMNYEQLMRHATNNYHFTASFVTGESVEDNKVKEKIRFAGGVEDIFNYLQNNVADEVLIAVSDKKEEDRLTQDLITMGLVVHINIATGKDELPNQHIEMIGNRLVMTTATKPFSTGQAAIKRLMDIVGGAIGLIFTGIFFVIFAPIIYIQSPGKIFYSQIRVGKNGRRFRMYKFRSMYPDADKRKQELMEQNKMDGFMFKMDNDPRIIPIGHFIRKFSIDEFPQFWNVFKGDMSLVGTRPPTEDEWEQYSPEHRARLGMKPGITGLWQVSGRSNITDFDEVVALDVKYIRNWNLKNDIKILFKTVKVVVTGEGSE